MIAADLPGLTACALERMTGRRPCPVGTYINLLLEAQSDDVTSDRRADFRRKFNGYYGVRRNQAWRDRYYGLFEEAKSQSIAKADLFDWVLGELYGFERRTESSFSSKLVATLDPSGPVIDSVIRGFLGRYMTIQPIGGLADARTFYRGLDGIMSELLTSKQAAQWFDAFDGAFGSIPGAAEINPVKKLDFLIWAGAPR